jgi:deazaflavin-dependent oxidoreductase (nitroreductase family)
MSREEVVDSPVGWVAKHVRTYVDSGGTKGTKFYGRETLLLTTRGRKTGTLRRTALYYGRHGSAYVVVGSNGGARAHPQWCRNVSADPEVTVQVGPDVFPARARWATAEERPALWRLMNDVFPTYASYEKRARRQLPVILLEPVT